MQKFPVLLHMNVYLVPTGNAALRWNGKPIVGTVSRVGRKYFYVQSDGLLWDREIEVDLNTYHFSRSNYGYEIYPSIEVLQEEVAYRQKKLILSYLFKSRIKVDQISAEAIKQIYDILVKDGVIDSDPVTFPTTI